MTRPRLVDTGLSELIDAIAQPIPAPGAGSAAAWTGSMAAGLVEMTAALASADDARQRAAGRRRELLALGDRDLVSYEGVLEATRLPPDDPSRDARRDAALSEAADVPLAIAEAAVDVAEAGVEICRVSSAALRGDASAGSVIAAAAAEVAATLVAINLAEAAGDPRVPRAADLARRAADARATALQLAGLLTIEAQS